MSKPFIISTFSKDVSGEYFNYFADTYEEAVKLAEDFYLQTGRVVAVERVAQHPLDFLLHSCYSTFVLKQFTK
jgi:hypothetical protein